MMTNDAGSLPFTDRRGGMIFFGILQILLGLGAMLMAGLMFLPLLITPPGRAGVAPIEPRMFVPAFAIYAAVGIWFIVLGIGVMRPRRWAWALTLVQSWMWLFFGLLTIVMLVAMAKTMFPPMPGGQAAIVYGCLSVVIGIFFVALPIAFVLFFRSANVRATAFARDPQPRWTDGIPLSVLGGGVLLVGSAVLMMPLAGMYKGFPVGPFILRGWAAVAMLAAFAALSAFCGVQLLRIRKSGWWATAALILVGAGYAATFVGSDASNWRAIMGTDLPPDQIDRMTAMYSSPFFFAFMAIVWIAYAVYLAYIRRFFFRPTTAAG